MSGAELYKRLVELIREGADAIPGHFEPVREALVNPILALTTALLHLLV
jgi:hypothetical protein